MGLLRRKLLVITDSLKRTLPQISLPRQTELALTSLRGLILLSLIGLPGQTKLVLTGLLGRTELVINL